MDDVEGGPKAVKVGGSAQSALEKTLLMRRRAEAFLDCLGRTGNVSKSADFAGIDRNTAYNWRRLDSAFAARWSTATELGTDALEDEAVRRAVEGKSDVLLIFMLKARRPDKFKDRNATELTGRDGGPIQVAAVDRPPAETRDEWIARRRREIEGQ